MTGADLQLKSLSSIPPKHSMNGHSKPNGDSKRAVYGSSNGSGLMRLLTGSILLAVASGYFLNAKQDDSTLLESYAVCSPKEPAIYTVDDNNSRVQCLLIQGAKIIGTGSLIDITAKWNARATVEQDENPQATLQAPLTVKFTPPGSIIVPGITDSHGHTLEYGASRQLPLEGLQSSSAVVAHVREFILSDAELLNDTSRYVEGWGWDHTAWPKEEFPTFGELEADEVVRGRPVVLQSKDGHALWVSETILKTNEPFPDEIDGGIIVRDDDGRPTGVFLDNAQDVLKKPPLTDEDRMRRFMFAVDAALSNGLTSFHDAGFDPASLAFFQRQAKRGKLPIRIYGMTYFDENAEYWGDKRPKIIDDNRLTARSVKIFADGALRSGGAALFEPYTDNPDTNGFMRLDPEVLYNFIPKFLRDGWQVNVHAIGDRANAIVIDAFESALKSVNVSTLRPRIEHAQIVRPADMKRLGTLGVIASVQPTHAVSDMWYAQDRLGPERVKNLYAFRSMVDAGARITLGSDFPVEDMNPLAGFHAAITRVTADGRSPHGPGGWFPEQRLTRLEALRGITIDPAYASFSDEYLGSLVPGKIADYVVLSQDIMAVAADKILQTKVLATVIDGRPAYGHI